MNFRFFKNISNHIRKNTNYSSLRIGHILAMPYLCRIVLWYTRLLNNCAFSDFSVKAKIGHFSKFSSFQKNHIRPTTHCRSLKLSNMLALSYVYTNIFQFTWLLDSERLNWRWSTAHPVFCCFSRFFAGNFEPLLLIVRILSKP